MLNICTDADDIRLAACFKPTFELLTSAIQDDGAVRKCFQRPPMETFQGNEVFHTTWQLGIPPLNDLG